MLGIGCAGEDDTGDVTLDAWQWGVPCCAPPHSEEPEPGCEERFAGFNIEVAEAVCDALSTECGFVEMSYSECITSEGAVPMLGGDL